MSSFEYPKAYIQPKNQVFEPKTAKDFIRDMQKTLLGTLDCVIGVQDTSKPVWTTV